MISVKGRFLLGLLAVFAVAPLGAQVTAAISGRVEDASGAVMNDVNITVRSLENGTTRQGVSDEDGNFRVGSLPLGATEVKAEKSGFKATVRTGIDLVVGQDAVVNLRLEVGQKVETVSVVEGVPTVNVTTASISGLVTEQQVKDLPLNGRSLDVLLATNPGSINYSSLKSPQTTTSDGNTFSVAGRRPGDNQFLLNGVEYSGASQLAVTPGGVSGQLLGIDGVREINVLGDTYGAQYGKRAGAQVSIVTQSGGNVVHGSVFEFLRNSALDARNFFDQGSVPPFRRNQFGGALGGPIRKNKLFLFGNYEGFRQSLAVTSVSIVPDDQARQGNLPNATTGIYAPVASLNKGMLPFMALWPAMNGPELLQNGVPTGTGYSFNTPKQLIQENFGTMRMDYALSGRDNFSLYYTVDRGNSVLPQADPLFIADEALTAQVASIQETHVFSPNAINTATFGYSRAAFNFDPDTVTSFDPSLSFVKGQTPGGITVAGSVTTTGTGVITAAGSNNAVKSWNRRNLFTAADDFQLTRGMHHLSAGLWFQRLRDNENSASRQLGVAAFASMTTLLQGTVTTFQVIPTANELGWRSLYGAWYAQDDMRLRPRLTVSLGIRHEFTTGWNEVSGRGANYIPDANGVLLTTPRVTDTILTKNNMTRLFAPRVSLAWDVFGTGKTAVRAGFGTYYSMIDALNFLMNSLPPANANLSYANQALLPLLPIIPNVPITACGPGVPAGCPTNAPQGLQPDAKALNVQEWNFTVEQQIARGTSLRVAYVGSFGTHGLLSVDPNTIPAQICNTATCVTGGTPGTTKGSVNQGQQYIPVATRPNPFLGAGFFWYTEGNSRYNALQTDIVRRLTKGFELRANYTYAKNLDTNSGLTGAQSNNQSQMLLDRNDVRRDWGPSALTPKHQSSISLRYELPFGRNQRWLNSMNAVGEKILGGWQINGITTLLSGFPFTPVVGSNRSGDGNTRNPDRPSVNSGFSGPVILGDPKKWYDPNAFVLPAVGTWGNLGRGVYTGPGLASLDLSVFKSVAFTERTHLQFRAEVFNSLNRANFGVPNQTVFSGGAISPTAGLITATATTARQIQLGLKLIF